MESTAEFIHRYVPGDAPGPTLLVLHGTGGNENDLLPVAKAVAPDAGLLSPRGKVLERGMNRFFRRLAEGVFDLDDLVFRTHELADWVGQMSARYGFDRENVWAMGFSNGANIAASMMLLRPSILRGAILFAPMTPLTPDTAPDLSSRPVFVGAGQTDPIATPEETQRLVRLLRGYGAEVSVHWTPDGHSLTNAEVLAAREWWHQE